MMEVDQILKRGRGKDELPKLVIFTGQFLSNAEHMLLEHHQGHEADL